jgi:hypothetical protein
MREFSDILAKVSTGIFKYFWQAPDLKSGPPVGFVFRENLTATAGSGISSNDKSPHSESGARRVHNNVSRRVVSAGQDAGSLRGGDRVGCEVDQDLELGPLV